MHFQIVLTTRKSDENIICFQEPFAIKWRINGAAKTEMIEDMISACTRRAHNKTNASALIDDDVMNTAAVATPDTTVTSEGSLDTSQENSFDDGSRPTTAALVTSRDEQLQLSRDEQLQLVPLYSCLLQHHLTNNRCADAVADICIC